MAAQTHAAEGKAQGAEPEGKGYSTAPRGKAQHHTESRTHSRAESLRAGARTH